MNIFDLFKDPKRHGSAGLLWNSPVAPGALTNGSSGSGFTFDPRYFQSVQSNSSENNAGQNFYEETDLYRSLTTNPDGSRKVQVRDPSRLIDPNAFTQNDELGLLTDVSNYKSDEDWLDKNFFNLAALPLAGATAMHALGIPQGSWAEFSNHFSGNSGLSGGDLPHGTEMPNTYAPNANPTSFYEPLGPGPQSPGLTGGDLPYGTEMPNTYAPGTNPSGITPGSGGLLSGGLDGLLGGLMKNPLQALGLLQAAGGLFGGNQSNSGSPGGSPGGSFAPLPKGNRGPWTPNPHTAAQIQNFKFVGGL